MHEQKCRVDLSLSLQHLVSSSFCLSLYLPERIIAVVFFTLWSAFDITSQTINHFMWRRKSLLFTLLWFSLVVRTHANIWMKGRIFLLLFCLIYKNTEQKPLLYLLSLSKNLFSVRQLKFLQIILRNLR